MEIASEENEEDLEMVEEHAEEEEGFFMRSRLKPQGLPAPRKDDIFIGLWGFTGLKM